MSIKVLFMSLILMFFGSGFLMVPVSLGTLSAYDSKVVVRSREEKNQEHDRTNSAWVKSAYDTSMANDDAYDDALTGSIVVCTNQGDLKSDCKGTALVTEMAEFLSDLTPPESEKNEGMSYYVSWKVEDDCIKEVNYGFIKDAFTDSEERVDAY